MDILAVKSIVTARGNLLNYFAVEEFIKTNLAMKSFTLIAILFIAYLNMALAQSNPENEQIMAGKKTVTCKLTTPELQKRKTEVVAALKNSILEKKELDNGFAYKFEGSDKMIEQLTSFIITERMCCDFFTFELTVADESEALLKLTGPEGTKEFIKAELDF
jgi:hypothetical protein